MARQFEETDYLVLVRNDRGQYTVVRNNIHWYQFCE